MFFFIVAFFFDFRNAKIDDVVVGYTQVWGGRGKNWAILDGLERWTADGVACPAEQFVQGMVTEWINHR